MIILYICKLIFNILHFYW